MSGWPSAPAIVEDLLVGFGANLGGDESNTVWGGWKASKNIFGEVSDVGFAAGEHVWSRFADQVLQGTVIQVSISSHQEGENGLERIRTYLVINHVPAQLMPSPSQPVNHSQSFLFQIKLFGTDFGTVGPGTRTKQTNTIIAAGTRQETMMRTAAETVSSMCGKLISGLPREKCRMLGDMVASHVPMAAKMLKMMLACYF